MSSLTPSLTSDKQQKGSFYINGYSAELVANIRKDSKKNACFELTAPGRRPFQVGTLCYPGNRTFKIITGTDSLQALVCMGDMI